MRIIGCGLIALWGVLAGCCHKWKLEQELRRWEALLRFFQLISTELQVSLCSSRDMLDKAAERCPELSFLQRLSGDGCIQQQLRAAAEELEDKDFQALLLRFADCFGSSSSEAQLDSLTILQQLCQEQIQNRKELVRSRGQLSLHLGLLGGTALAILLL